MFHFLVHKDCDDCHATHHQWHSKETAKGQNHLYFYSLPLKLYYCLCLWFCPVCLPLFPAHLNLDILSPCASISLEFELCCLSSIPVPTRSLSSVGNQRANNNKNENNNKDTTQGHINIHENRLPIKRRGPLPLRSTDRR